MTAVVRFPKSSKSKVLQRIQATYTVRDISRQFGLSESSIRSWTRKGFIPSVSGISGGELRYDFYALTQFRRIRELRNRGLSIRQIESEMHGQLNLFPEKAGRLLKLPVRRSPFEEALVLHENGDERAKQMYRLAILKGECISDAYCNLGIFAFENNEIIEAFDHFTNALKNDPRHFESHFNLAHLYFEAGDYRLAHLHYDISSVLEPNSASVHFNLGLIHAVKGDFEKAITALNKAKEFSTEEELVQVEELLEDIMNAMKDNKKMKALQELLPGRLE